MFLSIQKLLKDKVMLNLGSIKRNRSSFLDPISLKILYCSLVRFNLFISFKLNIHRPNRGLYDNVLIFFNLISLSDRRTLLLSKFLHRLLSDAIYRCKMFSLIRVKMYTFTSRNFTPFYLISSNKYYMLNSLANHVMNVRNIYVFDGILYYFIIISL